MSGPRIDGNNRSIHLYGRFNPLRRDGVVRKVVWNDDVIG